MFKNEGESKDLCSTLSACVPLDFPPRLGSKNESRVERMNMTIFDDDRWLHLMSVGRMQQLLPIIDRIQAAMVASTFNSTADNERARHHFATHTLPW